ncbi:hypothetical protein ACP275_13G172600 [Erythranthe tilingii]
MEAEAVLNLFDSTWFYLEILEKQPKATSNNPSSNPAVSQMIQLENHSTKQSQLTIETRSKSFDISTSNYIPLVSPNSVLDKPHQLQTILSEREFSPEMPEIKKPSRILNINKKKKRLSKSLSELEFEELKGFMDLGFVFSEEDKLDSSLADIIPGLHKLGQKKKIDYTVSDVHQQNVHEEHERARPYLSEVWERENEERELLMKWRVPVDIVGNEIDMKDSLKWWAHSVIASAAVR